MLLWNATVLLSSNHSQLQIRSGLFSPFVQLKITHPLSTNKSITFDCKSFSVPVMSPFVCNTRHAFDKYLNYPAPSSWRKCCTLLQGSTPTTKVCINQPPGDEDEDCALTVYTLIIPLENHHSTSCIDCLSN